MGHLILGMVIGLVAGVAGTLAVEAWLVRRKSRTTAETPLLDAMLAGEDDPPVAAESETESMEALRQNLRVKFLHDEGKVQAAIEFERQRDPDASEIDLLKAAIYRWERTNR